ncbi:MAG TPA: tetratricopeptide repeat-containing diguanylate cyclase [Gammaproteobacteria bacterium]
MDHELRQRLAGIHRLNSSGQQLDALENLFAEFNDADTDAAAEIAGEAIAIAREGGMPDALGRAALLAARVALRRHRLEKAESVLVEGLENATDAKLRNRLRLLLTETRFTANHYAGARDAAHQLLVDADLAGDEFLQANALVWLGAAAAQLSEYQTALENLHQSLNLLAKLSRPDLTARPLNYIAVVHEEVGEESEAMRWYQRALEVLAEHPDPRVAVRVFANYGELAARRGERERAEEFLRRAANDALRIGDHSLRAWCFWALANQALADDDMDAARRHFTMALRDVELGHAERTRAEVFTGVGRFHARLGNHDRAVEYLMRGLRHAERAEVNREIYKSHLALSEVHEQFGDLERALFHFKEYHRIRGAVLEEVVKAKVRNVLARVELEQAREEQEENELRGFRVRRAYEELKRLHAELAEKNRLLEEASIRDPLTGVYNRRYLDEQLASEFERSRRYGTPLSVAICDLDNFKVVNDQLSHAIGDETLRVTAKVMVDIIRQSDIVARYGGEEFVLVFPGVALADAARACEKIRRAVAERDWSAVHPELKVTLSVGVTEDPAAAHWERLLADADSRLYEAKRGGKNRVVS